MPRARTPEQTMALMARESRCHYAPIIRWPGGTQLAEDRRIFADCEFALRTDSGFGFHYVPGEGVRIDRADHADPAEEELWLNGSVYAAIACLNGLYPLHASAVAHGGRVIAFTGPSGAGKSTLVAALGQRGIPLFCDDTLLLDVSDPDRPPVAMPGHKRLKLTDHALTMTGSVAGGPVGSDTGKHYVQPEAGTVTTPLPLDLLVFLEEGPEPAWLPIGGAQRFARLDDDHYTQDFYRIAQAPDPASQFALRARLANQIAMARLVRPRSAEGFAMSLDLAESMMRARTDGD